MYKQISIYIILLTLIISCERDEICIDPITPHLIIRFYDTEDLETFKPVNNLLVKILDKEMEIVTTDTLLVPLNVYDTQTTIMLTKNSKDNTQSIQDTLIINYQVENVFVGRSCGFKSVFTNINYQNTNNWIVSKEVISLQIENEDNAHLKIFH